MYNLNYICLGLMQHGFFDWMPDELFLRLRFYLSLGKKLNLEAPKSFNEKIQWLKLYDRKDDYTRMVDKITAKDYATKIIGHEYIIPTLGTWSSVREIDFDKLPEEFVLKCNHDSGSVVICTDKRRFDIDAAEKKLDSALRRSGFRHGREWVYKNVVPQIFAEEYLPEADKDLKDYKFFCFEGKVKCFKIDFGRFTEHRANYYNINGEILPFGEKKFCPPDYTRQLPIPENLNKMIELAQKLSSGLPFLRVDLYNLNGKIYFGEMTFSPASGFGPFTSDDWDETLGSWLTLPTKS